MKMFVESYICIRDSDQIFGARSVCYGVRTVLMGLQSSNFDAICPVLVQTNASPKRARFAHLHKTESCWLFPIFRHPIHFKITQAIAS